MLESMGNLYHLNQIGWKVFNSVKISHILHDQTINRIKVMPKKVKIIHQDILKKILKNGRVSNQTIIYHVKKLNFWPSDISLEFIDFTKYQL